MPAGGHRRPDRAVHRLHVAGRPQPGHVVPALAAGQLRAAQADQKVSADRHVRGGAQAGPQAAPAAVGPGGGRHTLLEAAAGQRL